MELNFCRRCGSELTPSDHGSYVCSQGHTLYLNPAPCVGLFLFDTNKKLLLGVRGEEPNKGSLDAFGGFVDGSESVEEALIREIKEEVGLDPSEYTSPIYLRSASSTYEYQGETRTVLTSLFYAYLFPGATPQAADDVASIHTAYINDITATDIGNEDIKAGFIALQQRLDGNL